MTIEKARVGREVRALGRPLLPALHALRLRRLHHLDNWPVVWHTLEVVAGWCVGELGGGGSQIA